jgi:hypothetical protein
MQVNTVEVGLSIAKSQIVSTACHYLQNIITEPKIVICIARLRNPTLTNREKNCRQGRFAAETRQSRGRQRIS